MDALYEDSYVANGDARVELDREGAEGYGPGDIAEWSCPNGYPYPCGFVDVSGPVLEGEGDGDLSIAVDAGIGAKEEGVVSGDVPSGLHGQQRVVCDDLCMCT